jgi:hypothetical protein
MKKKEVGLGLLLILHERLAWDRKIAKDDKQRYQTQLMKCINQIKISIPEELLNILLQKYKD